MRALLVFAALVALALASGKSDIYITTRATVAPTVYYYHDDFKHYIVNYSPADTDGYTSPYSYRTDGDWSTASRDWSLHDYDGCGWDDMEYSFYDDLPLTPGTVLGFYIPVTGAAEQVQFSYWIRTEWFQSLYSRTCWYDNDADCYDEDQVIMCKNDVDMTASDQANWLFPEYQPEENGFYYPHEYATEPHCAEFYYHLPRNSFWLQASTSNQALWCRFVIPEPAFSDMTMEKTGCTGTVLDTDNLVHPVTETLDMDDFLTIYPPIHFTYYNELVRALTIYPMGVIQFNDWIWWTKYDNSDMDSDYLGHLTYFPDDTYEVDESNWLDNYWMVDTEQVNFTHPQYHGDWPRWVEWPDWISLPEIDLVSDDPMSYRSCQLSMWGDLLDYHYDTDGNQMVTVTYGLKQGSPNVFVIQLNDIPYVGACTPLGKGVTLQLQIYEDTSDVSRMEIHYINTDKPVERFVLPIDGEDTPLTGMTADSYDYWYQYDYRWDAQMPVIGMTSCDLVWGGKLKDYFPADGECVSIVGCRNGYHDSVTGACACAERFTPGTPSSNLEPRCQACGKQTYKYTVGDEQCSECPEYSIMPNIVYGMDDNSECECIGLFGGNAANPAIVDGTVYDVLHPYLDHIPCEQCAGTKSQKKFVGNVDCECSFSDDYPAPVNPTTYWAGPGDDGAYGQCECGCGQYGHGYRYWSETTGTPATTKNYYATCELCPDNTFKNFIGNVGTGTAGAGDATGGCESCYLAIHGATGTSNPTPRGRCDCNCVSNAMWFANNETCLCEPGRYLTGTSETTRTCQNICGLNKYKEIYGNEESVYCLTCPPDSTIAANNIVTDHDHYGDCTCATNYGVFDSPDTGLPQCYRCAGDLWDNSTRPNPEKILTNPVCGCDLHATAYLDTSVTPNVIRCGCDPEYEYTRNDWGSCVLCANGKYKSWYNDMTEKRTCQPCGTGFATTYNPGYPTKDGTGNLHCFCQLGWFASSESTCQVCGYGTILSPNCVTANGHVMYANASGANGMLHDMTKCYQCANSGTTYASPITSTTYPDGFPLEWSMTTLGGPTGANSAYWHDDDDDCFCPAGWYRTGGSTSLCGASYGCTECDEDTYRDITTTHKLDNLPDQCYDCPTSFFTGNDMQSSYRQKAVGGCYCVDNEWFNLTAFNTAPDRACVSCPANTYQFHYNREPKTSCTTCTGIYDDYYDANSECVAYNSADYPTWAHAPNLGRAMYLLPQTTTRQTSMSWFTTLMNTQSSWLPVPGIELTWDPSYYEAYYYDFKLDFEFLTGFHELSHAVRLYMGGNNGIFLMPGDGHYSPDWIIWPYDCDDYGYDDWYGTSDIYQSWYMWDPNDVFLSVAQTGSAPSRKFVIKMDGYHRFHDVYTDGTNDRMSVYFIIYEDSATHAFDLFVDNPPHLCGDDAQTGDTSLFQCTTRFRWDNNNAHIDNVWDDTYWQMDTPYYKAWDNYIRFDFAWCQQCQCHATNSYYNIFPENWDRNGCNCGCDTFVVNATATTGICTSCKGGFVVDHYGVCQSIQTGTNPTRKVTDPDSCSWHCVDDNRENLMVEANDCKCPCGYKYNATNGGTCWLCPDNSYSVAGSEVCTACPANSINSGPSARCFVSTCVCDTSLHFAAVPQLVGTAYRCMCDVGYTFSGTTCVQCNAGYEKTFISQVVADNQCTQCDYGYYKPNNGPQLCDPCGAGGYSGWITKTKGNTDSAACTCDYGYYWDGVNNFPSSTHCHCCSTNEYKPNQTLATGCIACKTNSDYQAWTCASRNECGCVQNFGADTQGNCKWCNYTASTPQYKMYRGQAACSRCTSSAYEILGASDPYIKPTFTLDDWANPETWTPLTTGYNTAVTQIFDDYSGGNCDGGYYADWFKNVRMFPTTTATIPTPEGTFKGLASFRDVNVYVRGQHAIVFAIEQDGNNYCANIDNDWYYDFGIMFGYKIDVETLRIRSSTSTATSTIEVSFDFEGVYGSTANRSNIIQLVMNKNPDASSNLENQKIYLVVGQISDITVPILAYFANWFDNEWIMYPDEQGYTDNCYYQFERDYEIDPYTTAYDYWPLCRMPTSQYIDTWVDNSKSQRWRYVAQFTHDPCTLKPVITPPPTCTAPNYLFSDNKCHQCPTCTDAVQNPSTGYYTCVPQSPTYSTFVWSGTYGPASDPAVGCQCAPGYFYSSTNNDCEPCDHTYKLGTNRNAACVKCPTGSYYSPDVSDLASDDLTQCVCNVTYTHVSHMAGANDATNANTWCRACPPSSRRRNEDGREMINQCICDEWFASIPNQFAVDGITPSDAIIDDSNWQCRCDPGYYGTAGNPKNYPDASPSLICLPCPINYYTDNSNANDVTFSSRCKRCANGLTPYEASWGKELCYCPAGEGGFPNSDTAEVACATCVGGTKDFDGNALCSCVVPIAIADPGTCKCPPGFGGDARGVVVNVTQECVECPADTYKNTLANSDCTPCPFGAQTFNGTMGATNVSKCECKANYYGLASNGTNCTYCHLGSKVAGDNLACTCVTTTGVTPGADGLCYCAPGYYFVYLTETCSACPADTYSTDDNLEQECTACGLHKTTSGSPLPWNSPDDCVCMAAYQPDGSGGCESCPPGTHKYNPGNSPCEQGSPSPSVNPSDSTGGSGNGSGAATVMPSAFVIALMGLLLFLLKL